MKGIIKLKSELTDDDEIVIEKKSVATKVNEKRIQDYLIDEIEVLKEYINNIKTYKSPQKNQYIILKMHLHLHYWVLL